MYENLLLYDGEPASDGLLMYTTFGPYRVTQIAGSLI